MSTCVITGSLGLVGSWAVRHFIDRFDKVIGIDNDHRFLLFGTSGLANKSIHPKYTHYSDDIRVMDWEFLTPDVKLIIHAAAQPSHDWATHNVIEDFEINTIGTIRLLEAVRQRCPRAVVIYCSTNKVYGDYPNHLPYRVGGTRFEPIDIETFCEDTPIDGQLHSFFGCSKLSADLYAQEYGRHLGLRTGIFRAGCITGPGHGGAELHGFLSYMVKCFKTAKPYTIFGYEGRQVRDNIHALDLCRAFELFYEEPRPGEVYNIGGGKSSNCSVLEAIEVCEKISKKTIPILMGPGRTGDHKYWVTDTSKFAEQYGWSVRYDTETIIKELFNDSQRVAGPGI